ncbi:hypothetical protein EDB86DRAFT_1052424 [Lactarius hatsudake]|nr:hypothetical protein EDB86DRAFT_1052424 [Lactarius hatsudake]
MKPLSPAGYPLPWRLLGAIELPISTSIPGLLRLATVAQTIDATLSGLTLTATRAMGDQIDLYLVKPVLLLSPMEGNTPYPREGYTKSHPRVPNRPKRTTVFSHPGCRPSKLLSKLLRGGSVHPRRFCLPVESVLSESTYEYTASPLDGGNPTPIPLAVTPVILTL